jgi:transporter family-2 protein
MVSFSTGLIFVTLIVISRKKTRAGFGLIFAAVKSKKLPRWQLGAGVLGASFVAMQTHVVPIAGVALFTVASLAGQTLISLFVDKIGLSGGVKNAVSKRRVIAAFITIIAVVVSAWDRFSMSSFSVAAIFLAVLAGTWVGVQRALNAQINVYSTQSFATSQLNFITGTTFLVFLFFIRYLSTGQPLSKLVSAPFWVYIGGSLGVIYIAFSATAVQHMGVLEFTLFSVGGMLVGSLALDLIAPTSGTDISWYLIAGILLTYLGVIANGQSRFSRR